MIVARGDFYLYRHVRLDTNEVFYVGVGTKTWSGGYTHKGEYSRAYAKNNRTKWWKSIVAKTKYRIDIILEFDTYQEALDKEKEFVKLYGRQDLNLGTLVNLSDGGEIGPRGRKVKMPETAKSKLSIANSIDVFCYDINGNFISKFRGIKLAAKELGLKRGAIAHALDANHLHNKYLFYREYQGEILSNFITKFTSSFYKKAKILTKTGEILEFDSSTKASKFLGIDRGTIKRRMEKYGIVDLSLKRMDYSDTNTKKKTFVYNNKGEFVKEFSSMTEVSKYLNRNSGTLTTALQKGYKTNGHYIYSEYKGQIYLPIKVRKQRKRDDLGKFINEIH